MNKFKKIAALGLVGLLSVSMLAGCSAGSTNKDGDKAPSTTEGDKKTPAASGEKTKVTVWTENRHDLEYMNKIVDDFNKNNTEIEIDYVVQTENYENLITMASSSGQAPDIVSAVKQDYMSDFANNGIIQPINDYITDEYKKVNDVDNVKFEGLNVLGDSIYYIPTGKRSGARIIYNKEIFDNLNLTVPEKLADMIDVAKKITEAGNGDYYGIIFPGASGPFERWLEHSAEKSGVTAYDYKNGKFDFTGFKPFLEVTRQLFEEESVFPGSASMKIDPTRVQFAEGHVGIHGNASQEATVLTEQFPATMEWGVADLPTLDGTIAGAQACAPNNGWMMTAATKNPEAAWKVIEYFGSEEVLKGYLEGGYTLPMSPYMEGIVDKEKVGRMADFAGATYEAVYPTIPNVTPEGEHYRDALWGASLPGGPDIDKTIETLNKTYNEALDQAISIGKVKRLVIQDYNPMNPGSGTIEYLDK